MENDCETHSFLPYKKMQRKISVPIQTLEDGSYMWKQFLLKQSRVQDRISNQKQEDICSLSDEILVLSRSTLAHQRKASRRRDGGIDGLSREVALVSRQSFYFFIAGTDTNTLHHFNIQKDIDFANTESNLTSRQNPSQIYYATQHYGFVKSDEANYRLWGQPLNQGSLIDVFFFQVENKKKFLLQETFCFFCFNTLETIFTQACKLLPSEFNGKFFDFTTLCLAQEAPALFWNLTLHFDSDPYVIKQFLCRFTSSGINRRFLRSRTSQFNSRHKTSYNTKRQASTYDPGVISCENNKEDLVHTQDNSPRKTFEFSEQETYVLRKLEIMMAKRFKEWEHFVRCYSDTIQQQSTPDGIEIPHLARFLQDFETDSKRKRQSLTHFRDPLALLHDYFDPLGFPLRSLQHIPLHQRRILYGFCCTNAWIAPLNVQVNEKGRAVYAACSIEKEDFVCEYIGELIQHTSEIKRRELQYESQALGCYMFYFRDPFNGKMTCIDATEERVEYGVARFINHSHLHPNCYATVVCDPLRETSHSKVRPRLAFIAKRFVAKNEELLIDYGETDIKVLKTNPWLVNS